MAHEHPSRAKGPDGQIRDIDTEHALNEAFSIAFSGKVGDMALGYLRSITVNRVLDLPLDSLHLAHQEGARWLMSVIANRVELGRKKLPPLRPAEHEKETTDE